MLRLFLQLCVASLLAMPALAEDLGDTQARIERLETLVAEQALKIAVLEKQLSSMDFFEPIIRRALEAGRQASWNKVPGSVPAGQPSGVVSEQSQAGDRPCDTANLRELLGNADELHDGAKMVPYYREGRPLGVRLFGLRDNSLYQKLGFESGDIALSVNDDLVSDYNLEKLLGDSRNKKELKLRVLRQRRELTLTCNLARS